MLVLDLQWLLFGVLLAVVLLAGGLLLYGRNSPDARVHRWDGPSSADRDVLPFLDELPIGLMLLRGEQIVYANSSARACLDLPSDVRELPTADWVDLLREDLVMSPKGAVNGSPSSQDGLVRSRTLTFPTSRTVRWWVGVHRGQELVVLLDVSDERRAQRASRALVSDLGHELRTPIATLLTHLEILGLGDVGDEIRRQSLSVARGEAQRMSRLVNDMLELGRLEAVVDLPLRPLDLAALVEEIVFQTTPVADERGISVRTGVSSGLPLVMGNADRLRQALLNLVDNALKYSGPGDEVTIALERASVGVACRVCDTGPGIPREHLPFVVQRFYRAAPETAEGSGLGLTLVQEVLRRHGTELTLESPVSDERGTCATFILPLAGEEQGDRR